MSWEASRGARTATLTRRRLLAAVPALAAVLSGLTVTCGPRRREEEIAAMLVSALGDSESLAAVGRVYLRSEPDLARGELIDRILADLGRGARVAGPDELRQLVIERTRAELAEGRLVSVDGWMLAETEAGVCALAALAAPERPGVQPS